MTTKHNAPNFFDKRIFCMCDIQYNSTPSSLLFDIGFIQQFDKLKLGLVNSYKKDIMISFLFNHLFNLY